jgi:molybdate transport system substrate-binding protein
MKKFISLLILTLFANITLAADSLKIAVASNMSHAMTDIASAFRQDTDIKTKLTFGSSGNFARQIIQGAPFRLFLSADSKYVDLLTENGLNLLADIEYARGRIGLFIPNGSLMSDSNDLGSAMKMLFHGKYKRLTIANPEHAPYGLAAQQALQSAGMWVVDKHRLLLAENAAQATQFVLSGNVDAGIIPASFAQLPELKDKGRFFLIPEQWHQPLQQHLVLLDGANSIEKQFFEYMQNAKAQNIIQEYGYTIKSSGE